MLRQLMDIARRRSRRDAPQGGQRAESQPVATAPVSATSPAGAPCDVPLGLPFMIRPAEPGDLPALGEVFRQSVRELAARDYDATQLDAWSRRADEGDFLARLGDGTTIVAEHHGDPVAFAQLHPADHVRMLYVRPDWTGLGIATLLCQYLEDEARIAGSTTLTTAASHTARRFFESMGYRAETEESVRLGKVKLGRTLMRKSLGGRRVG